MVTAELKLKLPGTWHTLNVARPDAIKREIAGVAESVCGRGDGTARDRALIRNRLAQVTLEAVKAGARSMFLGIELQPGVLLPATITVYEPETLSMSAAIGTDTQVVLDVLKQGIEPRFDDIHEFAGANFAGLRTITRETSEVATAEVALSSLRVDYWCHVPDSKRVVIVSCSTELAMIEHAMLTLFDAILAAAHFSKVLVVSDVS